MPERSFAVESSPTHETPIPMKPLRIDGQNRRLCAAHRTDGEECRAPAIRGGKVCRVHGGSAGHVKAAAERRLLEAVDPVVAELIRFALDDELEPRVRLAAIRDVLDRAGVTAPKQLEVVTLEAIDAEIARLEQELMHH